MLINKNNFLKALDIVKIGLAKRELISQSTSFGFIGDRIVTYNDEISVSHPIQGMNITGAIASEELYKILNKLKEEEIDFEETETEVIITSKKAVIKITRESKMKLPIEEIGNVKKWKKLPEGFVQALKTVSLNCSKDTSKPKLTCVHCSNGGHIEASDDHRIMRHFIPVPISSFLLPANSVKHVAYINPTQIAEGNGWVHFKTETNTILSCRIFNEDKFPDVERFLNVTGKDIILPEAIREIIERAMVFNQNMIEINLENKKLVVNSQSVNGKITEEAKIRYTDAPFSFLINPQLLLDITQHSLECVLSDRFLKFQGENWIYVTLLQFKK